jgi:hypothetical protein
MDFVSAQQKEKKRERELLARAPYELVFICELSSHEAARYAS